MKLILQAIKALLERMERLINSTAAQLTAKNEEIIKASEAVQASAEMATEAANKATASVAGKMNRTNPTGEGSFSIGRRAGYAVGSYSIATGHDVIATGWGAHAEGEQTAAFGRAAHAEGYSRERMPSTITPDTPIEDIISEWEAISVDNKFNLAYGNYSHTEGGGNLAIGEGSHVEGVRTRAVGRASHCEGQGNIASGEFSHAEGWTTIASGRASHAEGYYTRAASWYQHVQGKYNVEDAGDQYAHIVGNGIGDNIRSNAHTLDWDGNAWYAGTVEGTALILKSSTEGSSKRFRITVDDSGTLSAVEVTT